MENHSSASHRPSRESTSAKGPITEEMNRHNGRIFLYGQLLMYFSAPVAYIGLVQAALCDKLGTSATIANLPLSFYQVGQVAPLLGAWLVPHRHERSVVVWATVVTASLLFLVFLTLILPLPGNVVVGALMMQGLLQGFSGSLTQVFQFQCLTRGTTVDGRVRAMKLTYSYGPLSAVLGSLGAQYILYPGIPGISFPYDFALLYLMAAPCIVMRAKLVRGYRLAAVADKPRKPFFGYWLMRIRDFASSRSLGLLWLGYWLWHCSLNTLPNLSLYSKVTLGRDSKDFAGLMMALRFGFKAVGGYFLGQLSLRYGLRAGAMATIGLLAAGILWAWVVPSYPYLLAFGFMGAGELGGAYMPNFGAVISPVAAGPSNLTLLNLSAPASSFAPATHGALADYFGFPASFIFGLLTAAISICLVMRTRADKLDPFREEMEGKDQATSRE